MKAKDLIKKLQKMPPNMRVALWDGYNQEYVTRFRIKTSKAERFAITKKMLTDKAKKAGYTESFGEWTDYVSETDNPKFIQRKNFVVVEIHKRPKIKW